MRYLKTKELIYSLMRIAITIHNEELRIKINSWSLQLFEDLTLEDFKRSLEAIRLLSEFIKFGKMIYEIEPANADILVAELDNLESAIRQQNSFAGLPSVKELFSDNNIIEVRNEIDEPDANSLNAVIRQSSLLEKVRQFSKDGCQMKDLMPAFPEVSERTIRYDLQKLLNQDLIIRVGNGSSTSYVIK